MALQRHHLFGGTAKDLSRLRLVEANPDTREEWELRRLEQQFRDKHVTFLVRHPMHGVVAEAKVPIMHGKDYYTKFFKTDHPLTVHRVLPVSEYERCEVALHMPGGLELSTDDDYKAETVNTTEETSEAAAAEVVATTTTTTKPSFSWTFTPQFFGLIESKFDHFLQFDHREDLHPFHFSLSCRYPPLSDGQTMEQVDDAGLRQVMPTVVTEATICIDVPNSCYLPTHAFSYLKDLAGWMAVAHHLQDDAIEFARLQSPFQETYLLIEVGMEQGPGARRSVPKSPDNSDKPIDIAAYALVHLADEEGLIALFDTQSTHLHFAEREGAVGQQLPPAGKRVVHIFVLDLEESYAMKMGTGHFVKDTSNPLRRIYDHNTVCSFYCQGQCMIFIPTLEKGSAPEATKDMAPAATIKLSADAVSDFNHRETQNLAFVLELWKFLDLCLTGTTLDI